KEVNQELLLAYGYGDGGGGVNREMLEMRRRYDTMPGIPEVKPKSATAYFNDLHETINTTDQYVHTWNGELYFEYHRGTYTSQAFTKKMNRKIELGLRNS
ncbi:alpha-mannosidase, partial [Escherichia coli]|nr:alpha-mannosidase [Escherichia coli]